MRISKGKSLQPETFALDDAYEKAFARKRTATFQSIKILSYWFFGLQGYAYIMACGGPFVGPRDLESGMALTAFAAWFVSGVLALSQGIIALWNFSFLRWWMVALGMVPWTVIATEFFLIFVVVMSWA